MTLLVAVVAIWRLTWAGRPGLANAPQSQPA
jgi:hypothetical protein